MNNRQNGRRRGRGNNGGGGGGGQRNNMGNPNSGNRIDNRARGNANQLYEKYKNLARDAQMSGDRVNTEYYLQFADHYFRVLSESRARFEEQNPNAAPQRRIQPVDSFDDYGDEDDYAEEGEPIRAGEQNNDGRGQQGGNRDGGREGNRDGAREGNRYNGNRDEQRDQQRDQGRRPEAQDHVRAERHREDYHRDEPRRDEPRREERQRDEGDRYAVTGSPVANDRGEDSPDGAEPSPIAARRRGRPRRDAVVAGVEPSAALDADRLPPSLALAPSEDAGDGEEGEPAPRRRRRRVGGASAGDVQAG